MTISDAELQILVAHWCKVASEKAGAPVDLIKHTDRIGELMAEYKARRAGEKK